MSNEYIKNDFERSTHETILGRSRAFWTDKAEKLVSFSKPQMKSVDEIVPLTDLFSLRFLELTEAEREVMAGETVPAVLEAFKGSWKLHR